MAITINHNGQATTAAYRLGRVEKSLRHTLAKVAMGLRITRASDDAAALGMATKLETDAISTKQAVRNNADGVSIIQTTESAMSETTNILAHMRELAVQSASETLGNEQRQYIQTEYSELRLELDRISAVTEFNGIALTDGTVTQLDVQVGITNSAQSRITIDLFDMSSVSLGIGVVDLSNPTDAQAALAAFDFAIGSVNKFRSELGAVQNRLDAAFNNAEVYGENLKSAESVMLDADYASETAEMTRLQIMQQARTAALTQAKSLNADAALLIG